MSATFKSLREGRLPKATKAVGLLKNLVRYDHREQDARDLVNVLIDAVDEIDEAFARKWKWDAEPDTLPAPQPALGERTAVAEIPPGTAEGGAPFEAEVRWALDAIKRGDHKLAENRLTRILGALK